MQLVNKQWGTTDSGGNITLNISFTTTNYVGFAIGKAKYGPSATEGSPRFYPVSESSAYFKSGANSSTVEGLIWFAIGA